MTLLEQDRNVHEHLGGWRAAVGRTSPIPAPEIGRIEHVIPVDDAVGRLVGSLTVDADAVELALGKTSLLTVEQGTVEGVRAGLLGDGYLYVSAEAEAQGPPGGEPVTAIYEAMGR